MARKPLRPLIRSGGFYPSRKWTPLVYAGGYTTANGGEEPAPPPIEKTITGNPIHILDALAKPAQALSVKLEPVQDLNGYSYPWPAGGGKNLFNGTFLQGYWAYADGAWTSDTKWVATEKIPCKPSTYYTASADNRQTRWQGFVYYDNNGDFISTQNLLNKVPIGYTAKTPANAAYLIFNIAGESERTDNISPSDVTHFQIEEGQTATAYSPYSNICPISGWSEVTVEQSGKNLFDPSSLSHTSYTVSSDGSITVRSGDGRAWSNIPEYPLKAGTYTISATGFANNSQCQFRTSEDSYDTTQYLRNTVENSTFTLTSDGGIKLKVGTGTSNYPVVFKVQIESGSTATTYTPYNPSSRSISISLGQTVYGGTLDVTTGKLTVTNWKRDFTGAENWQVVYNRMYVEFTTYIPPNNNNKRLVACSHYKTDSANGTYDKRTTEGYIGCAVGYINNKGRVYIIDNVNNPNKNITILKSYLAEQYANNTPLTVVYELATPQTIQLTPQQVELLLGENNIWSDGEMTLTYLADGNASDEEALNILLGGRYVNNHDEDEPTDREALNIILGGNER